jgi:glycine dehydrogenase
MFAQRSKKSNVNKFFVSEEILPQTLSVLQTRSEPIGVELVIGNHQEFDFQKNFSSNTSISRKTRSIYDYADFYKKAADNEIKVAVAADILSLVKLTPGEIGCSSWNNTAFRNPDGLRWTTRRLFCYKRRV